MNMHTRMRLVILGTFFSIIVELKECKKLDGYKFPVYSTLFCPGNESEWKKRSSALNCNETNGYTCLPHENLTELLEFCYTQPWILIEEGNCLYLERKGSYVDSFSCRHLIQGCHNTSYPSIRIYEHPACISIGNGCFLADQSCRSSSRTTHRPKTTENEMDDRLWVVISIGIIVFIVCFSSFMLYLYRKKRICKQGLDIERVIESEEKMLLTKNLENEMKNSSKKESRNDEAIFDQWKQDDSCFISTKACEKVEKNIKSRNLVIVAGHSGSGKSAIIQHIALKYREQGWTVRRVKKVKDIVDGCSSKRFLSDKIIFVFNDPLGKEYFDELLNNSWQTYEEKLKIYLKKAKLLMSCRSHIISDARLTRYLVHQSDIIDLKNNKYRLSVDEKRQILTKYTCDMNLSEKDCSEIVAVDKYFPLLCKLYSGTEKSKNKGIGFFTEPITVLKEEIRGFKKKDKGKFCALALLVLFNDDLCVSDLLKNEDTENKFKHTLKLSGLPENTPPSDIEDYLNSIKDFFVKKVGDTYSFSHDFVMEVTTQVFGTDYPTETVKYADIGFLRRRVRLGNCEEHSDSFTICLSDRYIKDLGKRLYTELFGEHLLDVALNPCLRNEKVIEALKEKIADHPENLKMLLETKKLTIDKQELDRTSKSVLLSKHEFLVLDNEVSSLFTLIVFGHTQLSKYCIHTLQQKQIDFTSCFLISAMCCNGSIEFFNNVFKNNAVEFLKKAWGDFYPIHIVSVFQKYELLDKLIQIGINVNQKTSYYNGGWTPLLLAAGNDTKEYGDYKEPGAKRRDKTVQLLLNNGADINLCTKTGVSPLYVACQNGHDSTVQLLLNNEADINLCTKNGAGPLFVACENGHDSTVQLLLSNRANIKLCMINGASPLHVACQNRHDSTVQLLLSNGAHINLCMKNGASPLYIACENGHDSTVHLLLSNGADSNLCKEKGVSPLHVACIYGHDSTVQLLLSNGANINLCEEDYASPLHVACQNGHDSTVQLLLCNKAGINVCLRNGASPLYIACQKGHDSTAQLLLSNGALINLYDENGASPLHVACKYGHDSTVKLLLSNGANINLCEEKGVSPLHVASENRHDSTVQHLLCNKADINICLKNGASPLYIACEYGHDSTVKLLLKHGANTNLCTKNGASPLHVACQKGHHSTVQFLLNNGAHINLCMKNGASPLYIASENGHFSSVQLLLCNGADINLFDEEGASPLYIACQNRHDSTVQILLSNGAHINLCMNNGASPLYTACENGHDSTVQLLLCNGADINLFDEEGASPLHVACNYGHDSTVHLLLSNGADINLCMKNGASPLFIASENGHFSSVQLLLSNGADINLFQEEGASPLYIACQNRHDVTVQLLLSNGAHINLCMKNGASPLYTACENGHDSTVQRLLNNGANINLCEEKGASPLHVACQNRHDSTVRLLLSNGADINLCMKNGASPLYIASENGHYSTVQLLLNNGADINLCEEKGASPLHVAIENGHDDTVQLLLSNGADNSLCQKD